MKHARIGLAAFLMVATAVAVPARAAPSLDDALVNCARDADNAMRLACYDGVVATISADAKAATAQREAAMAVIAADKAKADEAAKTAAFGAERLNRGQVPMGTVKRVEAKVAEVLTASDGMAVLMLDNGQMWRQTTGMPLPVVRNGDVAIITVGMMGSYQLELVRQRRAFNVKRVR